MYFEISDNLAMIEVKRKLSLKKPKTPRMMMMTNQTINNEMQIVQQDVKRSEE